MNEQNSKVQFFLLQSNDYPINIFIFLNNYNKYIYFLFYKIIVFLCCYFIKNITLKTYST